MSAERARLFAALELPSVARSTLAHWGSMQADALAQGRRLERETLHATLCFLGWQGVKEVPAIARACRVVASCRRVVLTLGSARWLPERHPRVLAVDLIDDNGELTRLQATLSHALQGGGWYEPEQRPFLGHVTVARFPKAAVAEKIELSSPTPLRFVSGAVTLYRSHTDSEGARYQALETVGLNG